MHASFALFTGLVALTQFATAAPDAVPEVTTLKLWNGESSVDATHEAIKQRSDISGARIFARQSNINCKGSAFCERLGGSCDEAFRKIIATNTYSSYDGPDNTGTCSGTCGIFLSGGGCQATGQELIDAYNDIRNKGHCTHCGHWTRDSDQCLIKIDRVTGCHQ